MMTMKTIFAALALGAAALASQSAMAVDAANDTSVVGTTPAATHAMKARTAQQEKMATCNKDAAGKKGADRKAFMKTCLSAGKSPTQQGKMVACNKEAAGKSGADRKAFMKECLSNKAKG